MKDEKRVGTTLGVQIEEVQEFCYLGDVLDCEAGVESSESKSKCSMEKMEENGGFANRQKNTAEDMRKCL